jgi:hypothetical protein
MRAIILSAVLAVGALGFCTAPAAQAGGVAVSGGYRGASFGPRYGYGYGRYFSHRHHRHHWWWHHGYYRPGYRW